MELKRVVPVCPHAGECGGCLRQDVEYSDQLRLKEEQIRSLFQTLCPAEAIRPIIGCEGQLIWRYRNKMEFSFSQDLAGKRFLGLFCANSRRKVLDLDTCFLAGEWVSQALQDIRTWWCASGLLAYRPSSNQGSLISVTMRESATAGDRMVILTVSGNPDFAVHRSQLDSFIEVLKRYSPPSGHLSVVLRIRQIAKKVPTNIYEMILFGPDYIREFLEVETRAGQTRRLELHISPQAFFQPNTIQAMRVYSESLKMAALQPGQVVWDLYCGIGVFGMFASLETGRAIGVELSKDSAYDAKTNSERLGLQGFSIHCGDTTSIVAAMRKDMTESPPSVVIVDPPRAGLGGDAIEEIDGLCARTLVYVSCNPLTQVKDLEDLISRGWAIRAVQPIDQFPHTPHLENIVLCMKAP